MATPRNDPTELAPKLEIFNNNEVLQKTFETIKTNPSPTQDITVTDIILEQGVGTNWGKLVFLINDDSNLLTKNSLRRESTIERQWRVKLQLGKSSTTKETWFDGKILETEILRPQTGRQQLMVTCVGWGDVLRNRYTKLIRNQDKLADGIDVDDTDLNARIDELIFDLFNGVDHQIDDNFVPITTGGVSNLISYHKFHKVVTDDKGENNGTVTGVEQYAKLKYGSGFDFDGASRVLFANEDIYNKTVAEPYSIAFWVKPDAAGLGDDFIVGKRLNSGAAQVGYNIQYDNVNNDVEFFINATVDGTVTSTANSVPFTVVTHVAVTFSGNSNQDGMKIYINGVLNATGATAAISGSTANTESFSVGALSAGSGPFTGIVGEVRFYDKELTAAEVTEVFNAPFRTDSDDNFVCPNCLDIKIPNVNMTYSSYASATSRLMGLANVMWMIDPDRHLVARDPFAHDSGFLFTNDLGSTGEQNHDATKLGYILGNPVSWTDSSAQSFYNIIHGVGPFSPLLDNKNESVPDASDRLDTEWHAIPFKMENDNLFKIAVKAIKIGVPSGIAEVLITGGDLTLGPNTNDVRRTLKLNSVTLNRLSTTTPAPYFEIPIKPRLPVEPQEQLFIVFKKFGTGTDRYNVNYKVNTSAGNLAFWDSTNGTSWVKQTTVGEGVFRAWSGRRIEITVEMINATEKLVTPREKLIPLRADMEELTARQALIAASSVLGKSERNYSAITVSAPDKRPPLLKFCKIVDSKTGLDVKANMIGMNLEMHSQSPSSLGADRITLMMEDLF